MSTETQQFWAAAAVIVALLVGGAQVMDKDRDTGQWMIGVALGLVPAAIVWFFVWPAYVRSATTRVATWLTSCASLGTTRFVNHDVVTTKQAQQLKADYDKWHQNLTDGTEWYCQPSDSLRHLHQVKAPPFADLVAGAGDGHTKRLAWTMVERVRDLAQRLESGQTKLRRVRRFPRRPTNQLSDPDSYPP